MQHALSVSIRVDELKLFWMDGNVRFELGGFSKGDGLDHNITHVRILCIVVRKSFELNK